jgi:type I phosphodiesterase/nucleotide pyrophosphatase
MTRAGMRSANPARVHSLSVFVGVALLIVVAACETARPHADREPPAARNVIVFIPDGLRSTAVDGELAPTFAAIRRDGVDFPNSHSLFPTFTTPNASAMATGHYFGDTGDFGNTLFVGFSVKAANDSVTPFIEDDRVLAELDTHFDGNYLNEETLLATARRKGFSTATVGKLGPVKIFVGRDGEATIVIDDATGSERGIPLPAEIVDAMRSAGLEPKTPSRGANGAVGNATTPGTLVPNLVQQQWLVDVTTRVLLPRFKSAGNPFLLVFWSRDPDGTQHFQGDSFLALEPGINGPTSRAAIRNADDNLARIRAALRDLGLEASTDLIVTADHGFSTISKQSATSGAARESYPDVPRGLLPPGFVAIDLARALGLPLFDPDDHNALVDPGKGQHPRRSNGVIGHDPKHPDVVVAANGGSDLIYLGPRDAAERARRVVDALLPHDYISGIFVHDALGEIPGTLPLSAINLVGAALTPAPALVVSFRSFDTGCGVPARCSVEVTDYTLQQGQGMHGSFGRGDTHNFMAAIGPSFRKGFVDPAPVSNADVGITVARLLRLDHGRHRGQLVGRVLEEALIGASGAPQGQHQTVRSRTRSANDLVTVLNYQTVGTTRYFDAAGFPGRTVGLAP